MAIQITSQIKLPKPDFQTPSWTTYWHRLADMADGLAGRVVTVTKVSGATTLPDASYTADSGKFPIIRTSKTLTANVQVNVPARDRFILAENLSSGAFTWKIQTASNNNGVSVPQGKRMWLRSTTTGVIPVSRTDGRSTATEIGLAVITATHLAASSVTTAKLVAGAVTLPKIAGGGSFGRIMYTATSAGFPWATLARGTANQELAMSTGANSLPVWRDSAFRKVVTSTGIAFPAAGSAASFSHGITGISNFRDVTLQCFVQNLSTEGNYSAGEGFYVNSSVYQEGVGGAMLVVDSLTAVKFVQSSLGFSIHNKTTGGAVALTPAKWVIYFKVYAK